VLSYQKDPTVQNKAKKRSDFSPITGICVRSEQCMLPSVCVRVLEIGFSELFWGYLALR
jgi:hypothetical protein